MLVVGEAAAARHRDGGEAEGVRGSIREILVVVSTIHTDGPGAIGPVDGLVGGGEFGVAPQGKGRIVRGR